MNKVAIYNIDQCRFYIKNGATVLDIKIGSNGKVALIFEGVNLNGRTRSQKNNS